MAGTPCKGRQCKSKGRQQRPNKKSRKSRGTHQLPKLTKKQAEEEREAAIRTAADLAAHQGSDHDSGMDTNKMATDSDTERSTLREEDLPAVTPQIVDDLI
ncbi:hypothetical protein NDU88_005483 [Pleurodeles waltl]|uniref:Uncharacterized protein n=1 Tax=Pleurodeles waltl TaxID=8319 RepID=A0AAV7MXM6_PLEWA|nr:hypothetical protein NDU88_005483 [Pleurodeles waltl]